MRLRQLLLALAASWLLAGACGRGFTRQYEYEEQVYLELNGSATVIVDASIPALVALRGLRLDPSSRARFDPDAVRAAYEAPGMRVLRVSRPWRRHGRRFVEVRLEVDDIRRLGTAVAFAWSACRLDLEAGALVYRQTVGPSANAKVGDVGWTGDELVAFRLHLPSRILYHNARNLEDGTPGEVSRGNILTWEQRLSDRLRGVPIDLEARLDPQSILRMTLWLFGLSMGAAVLVLVVWIGWMITRGRAGHRPSATITGRP